MNRIFALILIAAFAISSCSKDSGTSPSGGGGTTAPDTGYRFKYTLGSTAFSMGNYAATFYKDPMNNNTDALLIAAQKSTGVYYPSVVIKLLSNNGSFPTTLKLTDMDQNNYIQYLTSKDGSTGTDIGYDSRNTEPNDTNGVTLTFTKKDIRAGGEVEGTITGIIQRMDNPGLSIKFTSGSFRVKIP